MVFKKKLIVEKKLERIPSFIVVLVILGVMFLPVDLAVPATISIVILTAILIASFKEGTPAFAAFTNRHVVFVGLISYSLYLWHWSVLSISRWTIGIHWWSVPMQLLLMFLLASFSYYFIELPFRFGKLQIQRGITISIGVVALGLSAIFLYFLDTRLSGKLYQGGQGEVDIPVTSSGKILRYECTKGGVNIEHVLKNCMFINNRSGNTIWLVGDSHAETLQLGVDNLAKKINFNFFAYFFGGTAFPPVMHHRVDDKEGLIASHIMGEFISKEVLKRLLPGDIVLISIRLPYHFGDDKYAYDYPAGMFRYCDKQMKCVARKTKNQYFSDWMVKLRWFLPLVKSKGAFVVLTGPTPEFAGARLGECFEQNKYWFNRLKGRDCSIEKSYFLGANGAYSHIITNLQKLDGEFDNFFVFDSFGALCPDGVCRFSRKGKLLYRDGDHLTNYASKNIIAPALEGFFAKVNSNSAR